MRSSREKKYKEIIKAHEKKIFDIEQLLEISKNLNSTLDFNDLMDSILFVCMGQMRIQKAGLFIKKGLDNDYLSLHRNSLGFEIDHSIEYTIPSNSKLLNILLTVHKCYTANELLGKIEDISILNIFHALKPSLIIPLKSEDSINGIIIIGDRIDGSEFTENEKEYLMDIALFSSMAIHNSVLYAMATTDIMTKLKLRHYFNNTLREIYDEAISIKKKLAIIMIDIDFFKKLNDSYGHPCGDYVLRKATAIIRENVRQIDIAARYGGEEFAILLPGADVETAMAVGERIRTEIERAEVIYEGKSVKTTISLGIAQFDPGKDFTSESIMERADKALYHSKRNGRNRITVDK
jgi:diguanylate cyclase (GGDEF)-like protein